MKTLLCLALACAFTANAQRIVYTKVFPKSVPAYVKITLTPKGEATYQEEANEAEPTKFQLDDATTTRIFDLAAKLDHFKIKLESDMKVAKTGAKTYRWENGGEEGSSSEATFNYTTHDGARTLQDIFERIVETERMLSDLARVYRYDRLGVNEILVRIENAWTSKRLIAPEQFVTLLDRIHKNESILNLARDRAAALSEAFKRPATPTTTP